MNPPRNKFYSLSGVILMFGLATTAFAGPIILGGDDLDLHGGWSGTANTKGWLYIQKAITSMYAPGCITRPNDGSIAVLGAPCSTSGSDAGAAIHFAANVALGKTLACYEGDTGPTGINAFFAALSAGTAKPAIIYIPSSDFDAPNGISILEGNALTAHANDLKNFVNSGGGLMAHIDGTRTSGWVTTLLPGLTVNLNACTAVGATLTAAGTSAFPALSSSDVNSTAGPCHASFSGNLGTLQVLGVDGAAPKRNFILGGGCSTVISASPTPTPTPTATPTPSTDCCDKITAVPYPQNNLQLDYRTFTITNLKAPVSPICYVDIALNPAPNPIWQGGDLYIDGVYQTPGTKFGSPYIRIPNKPLMTSTMSAVNTVKFNLGVDYTIGWVGTVTFVIHHCDGSKCTLTYGPWSASPPAPFPGPSVFDISMSQEGKLFSLGLHLKDRNWKRPIKWVSFKTADDNGQIFATSAATSSEVRARTPVEANIAAAEVNQGFVLYTFAKPLEAGQTSGAFNIVVRQDSVSKNTPLAIWRTYDENGNALETGSITGPAAK
ncbi:MAG: hypothetical protein QOD09_480 [Bradyrhizobium sp.]|jgi:hypothetical protein|nr:hypothetical protein [Bradyrhizobium sp.]